MLLELTLENCFVHKNFNVKFEKGLTAITGPNGAGKTLIEEMTSFALWGAQALRDTIDGYKGAKVTLKFELKNKQYILERSTNNARLFYIATGGPIVSGTKPVNAKIEELFGYSYDVYRTTNVARQGEIERMGQMRPTERKALVDETIGLSKIEEITTWAQNNFTQHITTAKVLAIELENLKPEPLPEEPSEITSEYYYSLIDKQAKYRAHSPYLILPEAPPDNDLEALKAQQQARVKAQGRVEGLTRALRGYKPWEGDVPELHSQDSKLEEFEAISNIARKLKADKASFEHLLKNYPCTPDYSAETLTKAEEVLKMRERWDKKQKLLKLLVPHECPECHHQWTDIDPRLQDYSDVPEKEPELFLTSRLIAEHRKILDYQEARNSVFGEMGRIEGELVRTPDTTSIVEEIKARRKLVAQYLDRAGKQELVRELEQIQVPQDVSDRVTALEVYNNLKARNVEAVRETAGIPQNIEELAEQCRIARSKYVEWGNRKIAYDIELDMYTKKETEWEEQVELAQEWKKVKEALILLRARIKGYLLPSLNTVASKLLSTMSAEWLKWVVVNEDFDIIVGGQKLKTLSGAGKTLTNLALRIGLGQVLTNSVFPVLILDEADAGVDLQKSVLIMEALQRLTGTIQQIIVISHKAGLPADHRLELTL